MVLVELILLVSLLIIVFYKWATYNNDFFIKRGIPHEKPFLFFGSFIDVLLGKSSFYETIVKRYNVFSDKPVFGLFDSRIPLTVIRDAEIIKRITVKDFDHFVNHRIFFKPEDEPIFGYSMLLLQDQKWKDMRSTLSPAFTGSKMRLMFKLITECCDQANEVLNEHSKENPKGFDLEMKDFCARYANDVIASSAFGLKIDCITGANSEFYEMGKLVTNQKKSDNIKFFFLGNFKLLAKLLNVHFLNPNATSYFKRLVLDTMNYRIEKNIHRPDMIDILLEARNSKEKSHNREWSDDEIVAQCFIFFFAGFETVSATISFAAHELMENPDCQEKAFEEVKRINEKLNGNPLTYENITEMKYLEMVLSETLRKWPPFVETDRVCTKSYRLETDNQVIDVNVGDIIFIPIVGLHNDPQYFPNPKKFDPERFSEENKGNIHPFAYCPFGLGPRNCIGARLAMMEAKAILFYLLRDFELKKSEKTQSPIVLETGSFQLKPKAGFWLKLVPRN